jgi:hypothetical protein
LVNWLFMAISTILWRISREMLCKLYSFLCKLRSHRQTCRVIKHPGENSP